MSLKPYTERQKVLIVNNIVRACEDIEKLSKPGYKFINLAQGFIAHHNLYGFRAAYSEPGSLMRAILRNCSNNQWNNFIDTDRNYTYYMSKRDIYNRIVAKIRSKQGW